MATVPQSVVNELMNVSEDIAELVAGNGGIPVLWTTATEWFEKSMNPDLLQDKQTMRYVNSGAVDDLEADWIVGNREDWMDFLKAWASEVSRAVKYYEQGLRGGELGDQIAGT